MKTIDKFPIQRLNDNLVNKNKNLRNSIKFEYNDEIKIINPPF